MFKNNFKLSKNPDTEKWDVYKNIKPINLKDYENIGKVKHLDEQGAVNETITKQELARGMKIDQSEVKKAVDINSLETARRVAKLFIIYPELQKLGTPNEFRNVSFTPEELQLIREKERELKMSESDSSVKKALFAENMVSSIEAKPSKDSVAYDIKCKIQCLRDMQNEFMYMENFLKKEAPKAKAVLEKHYKSIQKEIDDLVKKYDSMKKSQEKEGNMSKPNRDDLVKSLMEKVSKGELKIEELSKALKAGYETSEPVNKPEETKEVEQPANLEFADGLFGGFSLGSTLKQGPVGNVMTNIKENKTIKTIYEKNHGKK